MADVVGANKTKGVGFLVAAYGVLEVYSGTNSSPWTMRSFGGDPEKAAYAWEEIRWAVVFSMAAGTFGSILDHTWWPLIGTVIANLFMLSRYHKAIGSAQASGSTKWADQG